MRMAGPESCISLTFSVIPVASRKQEGGKSGGEQVNTSGVRESLGLWHYSEDPVALGDHESPCGHCLSTLYSRKCYHHDWSCDHHHLCWPYDQLDACGVPSWASGP